MSITAAGFIIFLIIAGIMYYIIPSKHRWKWLIVLSFLYVFSVSTFSLLFVIFTSLVVYFTARGITSSENHKRAYLVTGIVLSLSVLIILKYVLGLDVFGNVIFKDGITIFGETYEYKRFMSDWIVPIGLSYYTLQVISYLLDVYWGKIEAETNYAKVLLFTCYFPQMVQGPISKYSELAPELFKEHKLNWHNIKFGVQLMLWGYMKKIIIADRVGTYVQQIFYTNADTPYGATVWLGWICYGIQLYCDFSGGIDVIRGVSQCFDVGLKDNFRQPYFSLSLGEFWRRWHMSLGQWMKDYIFYPVSISGWMGKLKKAMKKKLPRKRVNQIAMGLADLIVFTLVGLWHGTGTNFLGWGLYNGIILAISAVLADEYIKWKKGLKIDDNSKGWKTFALIRTLIIITIGWVFDCTTSIGDAAVQFVNSFRFDLTNFGCLELQHWDSFLLPIFIGILLVVEILHEKEISIREVMAKQNFWVQVIFWILVIQSIACFKSVSFAGGFMYANF